MVFLQSMPVFQLFILFVISLIYYIILLKNQPYKSAKANSRFRKSEMCWMLVLLFCVLLASQEKNLPLVIYKNIGWLICIFMSVQLGLLSSLASVNPDHIHLRGKGPDLVKVAPLPGDTSRTNASMKKLRSKNGHSPGSEDSM